MRVIAQEGRGRRAAAGVGIAALLAVASPSFLLPVLASSSLPPGFVEERVATGFPNATALRFSPDGRLFVAGKDGTLWLAHPDTDEPPTVLLTLAVNAEVERGLLGIDFDPDFETNGYVYLQYTAIEPSIHNRVSRFTVIGDRIAPDSEVAVFDLPTQPASYHVGGALAFGSDGKLYVGVGENLQSPSAQTLDNLVGKVLRINPDGSIPSDNPFFDIAEGPNRAIWAYGLRNPFTIAVDPFDGRLYINDTGEDEYEEVDVGTAGGNFGWPGAEGYDADPRFVEPLYTYGHGTGSELGCAIDGGTFYSPTDPTFPDAYRGAYFFIDYCASWIRWLDRQGEVHGFAEGITGLDPTTSENVALDVGPDGAIYWLNRPSDSLYRAQYTSASKPFIGQQPEDALVQIGARARFEVRASGSAPLAYQWRMNGSPIPRATQSVFEFLVGPEDDGAVLDVVVRNADGEVTSAPARVELVVASALLQAAPQQQWEPSETLTYPVTVTNNGSLVWRANGPESVWLAVTFSGMAASPTTDVVSQASFRLPHDISPGESATISVTVQAPSQPGAYQLSHRLGIDEVGWFEDYTAVGVRVGDGWPLAWVPISILGLALVTLYVAREMRAANPQAGSSSRERA